MKRAILGALAIVAPLNGQSENSAHPIRVELRPLSYHIPVGRPVWLSFLVENVSPEPLTLTVPGTQPKIPEPEISLPLSHVFSGGETAGLTVRTQSGREWDRPVGYRAESEAPILLLAPHGSVGRTIDLRTYYPALRSRGQFRITWSPYGEGGPSASTTVTIAARKNIEITTSDGTMTLELFYDEAPQTVANFLELVQQGFYDGLTFHRIAPGYMVQGGCPKGDGTGVRPDGKRVELEINDRPHEKGTVSMALLGDEPHSGSAQFFISYARMTGWDGRYSVFARLVGEASFETLDKLMATPVDEHGRPRRTLYMQSVRTNDMPTEPPSSTWP